MSTSTGETTLEQATVRRGRGRPRDPETDVRIIGAAAHLMLERGFDKMTVDDVAARAGVGKATVYRRWPSKDDLAVAAMEQLLAVEFPEHDTGSIAEDLRLGFQDILHFANSREGLAFLRMSVAESIRDERIAAAYRASIERRENHARRTFTRAIERGEVRPDIDLDTVIQWLGGILTLRVVTGRAMPSTEDLDVLVEQTLHGIAVRS